MRAREPQQRRVGAAKWNWAGALCLSAPPSRSRSRGLNSLAPCVLTRSGRTDDGRKALMPVTVQQFMSRQYHSFILGTSEPRDAPRARRPATCRRSLASFDSFTSFRPRGLLWWNLPLLGSRGPPPYPLASSTARERRIVQSGRPPRASRTYLLDAGRLS